MFQIILFAPLLGALVAGLFGRAIGEKMAMAIPTALLFLTALLSWIVFFTHTGEAGATFPLFRWFDSGALVADWAIRVDTLTCVMLVVVTTVSSLVHLYSIGYMEEDRSKARFFAYLSFFTFAMLMLVTSDNLLQMFFGWEGVGVASYFLIGFWHHKPSANAAAIKAFIVNRVGDFGFLLGIFGLFFMVDSIAFDDVFAAAPVLAESTIGFVGMDLNAAELLCFLLFIGAMGKSAQFLLHTWLPDAMEGPTPVSALIHAATMVTAGVFLVCRMSPLMEFAPSTLIFITVIGATTAFFAATVGLVQTDIKRVIAYSTCSQLGYMFAAAGVGAYEAAMFHLFTHAFFKALLFLGAGSVIHAMHHEQDMRHYGGLRKKIPLTYWMMMAGTLAITGVGIPLTGIGFAGFLSKDAIIESVFAGEGMSYAFVLLVVAAAMTSFYSWRLIFLTFFGETRADAHTYDHAHESPNVMMIPLYVLAFGAVVAGMVFYGDFFGHHENEFWAGAIFSGEHNHVVHDAHGVSWLVKASPFFAMLIGFVIAYVMYILRPGSAEALARQQRPLYLFLLNKWYFDEIYDFIFVRFAKWLGRFLWRRGDGNVIDGAVNGLALGVVPFFTGLAGRAQSGFVFHYAFAMILGICAIITWYTVVGG
ncbi:NADH-quinone oxidoreductase subunit L [Pikeienuella piscinae]|uniref:NADH-quinone oxidoreductase subunit L n=1 Tax=Pikeienuella piscinae TaxID=2748098 RepID=A0A7L5BUA8_9RHOB|nr:NADH-quinone oxidoreductase subunit L [Pikeienuella piscinae]QIE54248.1 NADH-quinone oxidoreductase subunit L [Pikeienuella piscinae]